MKRAGGLLLQQWAHQELRLHFIARGIRLVQWREFKGKWLTPPDSRDFDGVLTPTAEVALRSALNNRAAFVMLDATASRLKPDPSVLDKRGQLKPHRWEEPHDVPGQSTCWLCLLHRDDVIHARAALATETTT